MPLRRSAQVLLFVLAATAWLATVLLFSPPQGGYRFLFLAVCLAVAGATYWMPIAGWWALLALVPVANMPARALALGAHEALAFIALAFGLGWWANRIVTRRTTMVPMALVVPLVLAIVVGVTSGLWTALRYADFYPVGAAAFRNVWVNLTEATDAVTAVKMVVIALARYLVFPVVFWASLSIRREAGPGQVRQIVNVWAWTLLPVFALVLYQSVFNPSFCLLHEAAWSDARRVSGGMTDPNALGLFLFLFLSMAVVIAIKEHGLRQVMLMAVCILGFYAVVQSGSRSALMGFGLTAAMVAGVVAARGISARTVRGHFAALAAGAVLLALVAAPFVLPRLAAPAMADTPVGRRILTLWQRSAFVGHTEFMGSRAPQWRQAVAMWRDVPLAGIGMGAFSIEIPNYNRAANVETPMDNAWNQYLQWLAELGVLGVFFWLWFCGAAAVAIVRNIRARGTPPDPCELALFATLCSFLMLCFFGAHLHAVEVSCACAVMLAAALSPGAGRGTPHDRISPSRLAGLVLVAFLVCAAQAYTASGPLRRATWCQRFGLPTEFGLYRTERWNDAFSFQWTQKYAGKNVAVPATIRVLSLRLCAFDPTVSLATPRRVKVWINGMFLDTVELTSRQWEEHDLFVYNVPRGPATLAFECDRVWWPTNESPPRALGVALARDTAWRSDMRRESQDLSPWLPATFSTTNVCARDPGWCPTTLPRLPSWYLGSTNVLFRWTGQRAARMITVGPSGVISLFLRAPADMPFYRAPLRVKIYLDQVLLKEIVMPRDSRTWVCERVVADTRLQGHKGILWLETSRTTRIRVPGSVRRITVGVAMAEIVTY